MLLTAILPALLLAGTVPAIDPAQAFGRREEIEQASLSPDGTKFAFLGPRTGQGSALYVVDLATDSPPAPHAILVADGDPERISSCRWAANTRLVCSIYGITSLGAAGLGYTTRYVAVDSDSGNLKLLYQGDSSRQLGFSTFGGRIIDWLPDEDGAVLMMREYIPEASIGTRVAQTQQGIGVGRVDTRSGLFSRVESPRDGAWEYITDGRGNVRIMGVIATDSGGYSRDKTKYMYRKKGSRDWEDLSIVTSDGAGFDPYGVDPDEDVVYGLKTLNGRKAAYKIALDGSLKETLIFAHPSVDVDRFLQIGRRGRIVGVSFATDRRETFFFDPELRKLAASLARAMPTLPLIQFVDSSVDGQRLLIWAGSDTDAGRYYLFDRSKRELNELLTVRPALANVSLASVKPISYKAADGTNIPAYLTMPPGKADAKGLPAIVMPHGGPGARDEWGFDWLSQYFANRGFAVLQPNFRGSAGYGQDWFAKNGFQNWHTAISDVDDGGRWLISSGIADPKKLAIVGWSYGGYAALQSAATEPGLFGAVVAIAPVTDLDLLREESRYWSNYNQVSGFIGTGPHVEAGSPARHADKIRSPVLMFHGTYDRNVGVRESQVMASRLKSSGKATLVTFNKLDHYLNDSEVRSRMLSQTDSFLRTSLGISP